MTEKKKETLQKETEAAEKKMAEDTKESKETGKLSETWAQDGKQELLDWIEEQGVYIRE